MVSALTLLPLLPPPPPPPPSPPQPPPPPPSPLAQSTRYTDAACVALDTHAMRAFADQVAGPGPDDVLSLCTALGGPGPCATFCQAPQLDERQPLTRNPNAYLYPNPTTLTLTPALPTVRPRCG